MRKVNGLLVLILLLSACTRENDLPDQKAGPDECPLIALSDFDTLGILHNAALSHAAANFDPDVPFGNEEEAVDIVAAFNRDFVTSQVKEKQIHPLIDEHAEEHKWLVVSGRMYDTLFGQGSRRNLKELSRQLFDRQIIDAAEYDILNRLTTLIEMNYRSKADVDDLADSLRLLARVWESQGYTSCSEKGRITGIVLAIGIHSVTWWQQQSHIPAFRVAPWVALDAAGAIVGAATGAIGSYAGSGSVNWTSVGVGAGLGAISASTGLVGRIAKWFT